MNNKNAGLFVSVVMGLGLLAYLLIPQQQPTPSVPQLAIALTVQHESVDPIKDATSSVFEIRFNDLRQGGTAFLVGRHRVDENTFRYNAITASHVLENLKNRQAADPTASMMTHMSFNPWNAPMLEAELPISIEWFVPAHDWACFTFELQADLPCLQLATNEEINLSSPVEPVYIFGSEDLEGVIIHATNIAALTNRYPTPGPGQFNPLYRPEPWLQNFEEFLRLDRRVIPGASGGAVLNESGHVIAIVIAYWNNTCLALKASVIVDQASATDLFVVEK